MKLYEALVVLASANSSNYIIWASSHPAPPGHARPKLRGKLDGREGRCRLQNRVRLSRSYDVGDHGIA